MVRKIKYGKILAVISITVLIWVWADLAKTEEYTVSGATITVAESANPNVWVSFDDESSVLINKIELKGSASRIAHAKRKIRDEEGVLKFILEPEQEAMTKPRKYSLDVLDFLRKSDQIRQLGLTVESCEPDTLAVNVVELVEKSLVVKCVGEDRNPVKAATIKPARVDMFVPGYWEGEKLAAEVRLTQREIAQARLSTIEKIPYIVLPGGQSRDVPTTVRITMPPEEDALRNYTITAPTLGVTLSANLQGQYKVEVKNLDAVMSAISIVATADAKRTYEEMRYQVMLEIYDSDKDDKLTESLRRELIYNFPAEYVREGEIELKQQPVIARFKLVRLPSVETPSSVGD